MRAVVFDLDGTLVDSAADIRAAVNTVLAAQGCGPLDRATVISFVGNGLPKLVERVMRHVGLPMAGHADLTALVLREYNTAPHALTRPYPGVVQALEHLRDAGFRLGLCTNKPEGPAHAVLQGLGLAPFFASVVGGDRLAVVKPDPAPLQLCLRELGVARAVFVGDSEVDAETAVNAGLPFALYTRGYRKAAVADLPHQAAFDDFAGLPAIVARLAP